MSLSGSGATWLSVLDEKKEDIHESIGRGYKRISDGRIFRTAFENLCLNNGEHKPSRLEAVLLPSYTPITDLAKAVGQSATEVQHLKPSESLECLIWSVSYALIEFGWKAGIPRILLIDTLAGLNSSVPRFSTTVGPSGLPFPNEKRVQKPLQEVYSLLITAYIFMISQLKERDVRASLQPAWKSKLNDYIKATAITFQEARGRYDVAISQAASDEERRKSDREQPSLEAERRLPDCLHSNSTSNREVQARFISKRILGRGSFGEVDEVREFSTGAAYARKHIHLDSDKPPHVIENEVKNEVAIMQKLRHLHIATVLFYLKEDAAYSIFMLPVADYDLRKFLNLCTENDYQPSLTKQIYPWFGCLVDALAYAHKLKIKHQDIKPSNILIKNNQPYLCDFGLAKDFAESNASTSRGHKVQGTLIYRAPEVLPSQGRGRKADVFALGCVYSEMFTVAQECSLEEYREARQTAGSIAFRDCLVNVKRWLTSLDSNRNRLSDLLVDQILSMVEEGTEERHTAEQTVNVFKRERALFCVE